MDILTKLKNALQYAVEQLTGDTKRIFKAKVTNSLGVGGQRAVEKELGWNRGTIRKAQKELSTGKQKDNFSARGRKKVEQNFPTLNEDIKDIVDSRSQTDATFKTTILYSRITAKQVRKELIKLKQYKGNRKYKVPSKRTINEKLNKLGYRLRLVGKNRPIKKLPETDGIFEQLHIYNNEADSDLGLLRLSMDAKARIKVGQFSRGGKSRQETQGSDHDFQVDTTLGLWGIQLPACGDMFFYFTESKITADFIIDRLEELWPKLKEKFNPHTLVINLDNGPENNSYRTQFMKRLIQFSYSYNITIRLCYYPPYHSKYNPIERVWGGLEKYWNGELLDSIPKVLGFAKNLTWKGKNPTVELVEKVYQLKISVPEKIMKIYHSVVDRFSGLERWFVDILPCRARYAQLQGL
jgi:hypothetical protein